MFWPKLVNLSGLRVYFIIFYPRVYDCLLLSVIFASVTIRYYVVIIKIYSSGGLSQTIINLKDSQCLYFLEYKTALIKHLMSKYVWGQKNKKIVKEFSRKATCLRFEKKYILSTRCKYLTYLYCLVRNRKRKFICYLFTASLLHHVYINRMMHACISK